MKRILSKIIFQDKHEVDLQFCPTYTMLHWTTVPVLPATLFISSWSVFYFVDEYTLSRLVSGIHMQLFIQILAIKIIPKEVKFSFIIIDFLTRHLFLASRRAEERSLNVPKQALSIFSMMIPLSTPIFQSSRTPTKRELKRRSEAELSKLTEEQKRKAIKSVTMKDGPRPRQLVMIALIWIFSTFLGVERTGDIFLKLWRKYRHFKVTDIWQFRPEKIVIYFSKFLAAENIFFGSIIIVINWLFKQVFIEY